jgi:hypothetical protein
MNDGYHPSMLDDAKMLARLMVQAIGGGLMVHGVGNAAVLESLAGAASIVVGIWLSRRSRITLANSREL